MAPRGAAAVVVLVLLVSLVAAGDAEGGPSSDSPLDPLFAKKVTPLTPKTSLGGFSDGDNSLSLGLSVSLSSMTGSESDGSLRSYAPDPTYDTMQSRLSPESFQSPELRRESLKLSRSKQSAPTGYTSFADAITPAAAHWRDDLIRTATRTVNRVKRSKPAIPSPEQVRQVLRNGISKSRACVSPTSVVSGSEQSLLAPVKRSDRRVPHSLALHRDGSEAGSVVINDFSDDDDDDWLLDIPNMSKLSSGPLADFQRSLESKMGALSAGEIEGVITAAAHRYGVNLEELQRLVFVGTQWGRLEDFMALLEVAYEDYRVIWVDTEAPGLADALLYVAGKVLEFSDKRDDYFYLGKFPSSQKEAEDVRAAVRASYGEDSRLTILVDDILIRRMEEDKAFKDKIVELTGGADPVAEIVVPTGMADGVNAFTTLSYKEDINNMARQLRDAHESGLIADEFGDLNGIDTKWKERVAQMDDDDDVVKNLFGKSFSDMTEEEILEYRTDALAEAVLDDFINVRVTSWYPQKGNKLEGIGFIRRPMDVSELDQFRMDPYEAIAYNLRPKIPDLFQFTMEMKAACGDEADIAETLDKDGTFLSMTNLALLAREIYSKVKQYNSFYGEPDLYYVPTEGGSPKSYTIAALIYLMANPAASPSRVVSNNGLAERLREAYDEGAELRVLLLDDYAGSGQSLVDMAKDVGEAAINVGFTSSTFFLAIAPMVESALAHERFKKLGIKSFGGKILTSILSRGEIPKPWMGGPGFKNGFYFVTMPYMSPDNNVQIMSEKIAPMFVLDIMGVKQSGVWAPICDPLKGLDVVLSESIFLLEDSPQELVDLATRFQDFFSWPEVQDHPACAGFLFQYYCKADARFPERNHRVDFSRWEDDYDDGRWDSAAMPSAPSKQCIQAALEEAITRGVLDRAGGSSGDFTSITLSELVRERLCDALLRPSELVAANANTDNALGIAGAVVAEGMPGTGLYGFTTSRWAPAPPPPPRLRRVQRDAHDGAEGSGDD